MTYQKTLEYLFSQLPMFHRIGPAAYKNNLDNTLALSRHFGQPEKLFPSVHIAGTNGKGSVANMLAAIFQQQGYKTGLATSPHLKDFRERIRINGKMISKKYVSDFVADNMAFFDQIKPSFFELTIALTFRYFADQNVDIAIVETGLGGRLDSTNIIIPELSIITNIGLDHVNLLGNTPEKIAIEKAGIIKKDVPVVIGQKQDDVQHVFKERAIQNNSELLIASEKYQITDFRQVKQGRRVLQEVSFTTGDIIVTDLLGKYQKENLATVLQAVEVINARGKFKLDAENVNSALSNVSAITGLKGRWQILRKRPLVICDTGHNKDGIEMVLQQLYSLSSEKLRFVFGMVDDKDINSILSMMPRQGVYYFCKPDVPRGLDAGILREKARQFGLDGKLYESVKDALQKAVEDSGNKDVVFVGGSTFVVAEVV